MGTIVTPDTRTGQDKQLDAMRYGYCTVCKQPRMPYTDTDDNGTPTEIGLTCPSGHKGNRA